MSEYVNLHDYGLEFKNIITGPAPVGRILNYTIMTGQGILKHKNGSRNLHLMDGIGSAWTTEFLVGLGIAYYDKNTNAPTPLILSRKGKMLYDLIHSFGSRFDEGVDITDCRKQLLSIGDQPIRLFEHIFRSSVVFKNLELYLDNNGKVQLFKNNNFIDNYFEFFKIHYEGGTYNRSARTTTGQNRVPSLIQLCQFFGYLTIEGDYGNFDLSPKFGDYNGIGYIDYSNEVMILEEEDTREYKTAVDIETKYGIDGNVIREVLLRNSRLQDIFRHNLMVEFKGCCAICGENISDIMIASHIKPSSTSDVYDKVNHMNGLLLCANHDRLFDNHLISFDFDTGKLLSSKKLDGFLDKYNLSHQTSLDPKFMTNERKNFLMIHNLEFHSKNKE